MLFVWNCSKIGNINEAILIKDVDFLFNRQYCIIVVIYE